MQTSPFDRLLPPHDRWRGSGARVALWSIIEVFWLAILVGLGWLIIDLLVRHGEVRVAEEDLDQARGLVGEAGWAALNLPDSIHKGTSALCEDSGLFPTLWTSRGSWMGAPLAKLFSRVAWVRHTRGALSALVLGLILAALAWLVSGRSRLSASYRWVIEITAQLRSALHRQALRLGPADLEGRAQQSAFQLFTTDVDRVRDGLAQWSAAVVRVPAWVIVFTLIAFNVDWRIALQCAAPALLGWWFYRYEQERADLRLGLLESQVQTQLQLLSESLRKTRIVRGYGMEQFEQERFQSSLSRFSRDSTSSLCDGAWELRTARFVGAVCLGAVAFVLSIQIINNPDRFSIADGFLTCACLALIVYAADRWFEIDPAIAGINTAAGNIHRYLDEIPEVGQAVGARFIEPLSKTIIFDSVDYSRGGRTVLSKFDLRIAAKETTALISTDSLSARTAAYMLPRFLEPQSGRVLYDSEDLAWGTLESIRAETLYVGGSDPFFTGTVLENLTCGDPAITFSQASEAAKTAHAHQFILHLRQGYETAIGEHGETLEPGEAFRLSLARALVREPAVLIIEEPDLRLDEDTKSALDDTYNRLTPNRTVIFLPKRMSTLRRCNRIVLLHEGRVAASGPQAELVQQSELYRHWEYTTFNTFRRKQGAEGQNENGNK